MTWIIQQHVLNWAAHGGENLLSIFHISLLLRDVLHVTLHKEEDDPGPELKQHLEQPSQRRLEASKALPDPE